MRTLKNAVWALALAILLASAGVAQDKHGVKGTEVFSTSTPRGGGTLESQGVSGERTPWFLTHSAPALPGVVNVVVTYYDSQESLDKAKAKEQEKKKQKDKKKKDPPEPPRGPDVPTYDPRFYDYKDGKLVPKSPGNDGQKETPKSSGKLDNNRATGEVIQPSQVRANEPFTFALAGSVSGEVVEVRTAQGEVIQQARADKYGRVFLPAGLTAGAYLVSTTGGHGAGKIAVRPSAGSYGQPAEAMHLEQVPEAINLSEPLRLSGEGFSANAANMSVNNTPVLAATKDELVCAPLTQRPGMTELKVSNAATGETAKSDPVLAYRLEGHIEQQTLVGGQRTFLRLGFAPPEAAAEVKTRVMSGPVNFGQGSQEITTTIRNGEALLPVFANVGSSGPFVLAWNLLAVPETTGLAQQEPHQPDPLAPLRVFKLQVKQATDFQLEALLRDLNRRKDYDYAMHSGSPGPDSAWLWERIEVIMAELVRRGYTFNPGGTMTRPDGRVVPVR